MMRRIACMLLLAAALAAPLPCRAADDTATIAGGVALGGVVGAVYEVGLLTTATALAVGAGSVVGTVAVAGLAVVGVVVGAVVVTGVVVVSSAVAVVSAASLPVVIGATAGGLVAWTLATATPEQQRAIAE